MNEFPVQNTGDAIVVALTPIVVWVLEKLAPKIPKSLLSILPLLTATLMDWVIRQVWIEQWAWEHGIVLGAVAVVIRTAIYKGWKDWNKNHLPPSPPLPWNSVG